MALINCSECNNQISDKAPTCPNCGAPNQVKEQPAQQQAPPQQVRVESNLNQHKGAEVVYYSDNNGVRVTNTRFIVGSSTFPLQGITSIQSIIIPVNRSPAVLIFVIGLGLVIGGASSRNGGAMVVLGILLCAFGVYWYNKVKDSYGVQITTSAAESKPLTSKNQDYIENVTRALNEAIIHRG